MGEVDRIYKEYGYLTAFASQSLWIVQQVFSHDRRKKTAQPFDGFLWGNSGIDRQNICLFQVQHGATVVAVASFWWVVRATVVAALANHGCRSIIRQRENHIYT
ncbi:MAG: hypothetical protein BWY63_00908 [Chloroflexi bacterium ADurb.Bin360]|nr:MAG: hypothetical protein BWY63_00908 [Chloroflexi bacterium ADurb.Bin360]